MLIVVAALMVVWQEFGGEASRTGDAETDTGGSPERGSVVPCEM